LAKLLMPASADLVDENSIPKRDQSGALDQAGYSGQDVDQGYLNPGGGRQATWRMKAEMPECA